jgi:hypothetical protein
MRGQWGHNGWEEVLQTQGVTVLWRNVCHYYDFVRAVYHDKFETVKLVLVSIFIITFIFGDLTEILLTYLLIGQDVAIAYTAALVPLKILVLYALLQNMETVIEVAYAPLPFIPILSGEISRAALLAAAIAANHFFIEPRAVMSLLSEAIENEELELVKEKSRFRVH